MKIVYFSVTGQTRRFVKKTNIDSTYEIKPLNPLKEIKEPFLLIVPTYEKEITAPVFQFLECKKNALYCKGVIGTGNRNFAELFIFTAKDIEKKYAIPLLMAFEFAGTTKDVEKFKEVVKKIELNEFA